MRPVYVRDVVKNKTSQFFNGDIILDAITRYKLVKSLTSSRGCISDDRESEILRVIENAIYTALEAYKHCNESPCSKMLLGRYIGAKTQRRIAAQLLELLPKVRRLNDSSGRPENL